MGHRETEGMDVNSGDREVRGSSRPLGISLQGSPCDRRGCWDVHNYSDLERTWDYGDWHHAAMGVDVITDHGPTSVMWTDTFHSYGVELPLSPSQTV